MDINPPKAIYINLRHIIRQRTQLFLFLSPAVFRLPVPGQFLDIRSGVRES